MKETTTNAGTTRNFICIKLCQQYEHYAQIKDYATFVYVNK